MHVPEDYGGSLWSFHFTRHQDGDLKIMNVPKIFLSSVRRQNKFGMSAGNMYLLSITFLCSASFCAYYRIYEIRPCSVQTLIQPKARLFALCLVQTSPEYTEELLYIRKKGSGWLSEFVLPAFHLLGTPAWIPPQAGTRLWIEFSVPMWLCGIFLSQCLSMSEHLGNRRVLI